MKSLPLGTDYLLMSFKYPIQIAFTLANTPAKVKALKYFWSAGATVPPHLSPYPLWRYGWLTLPFRME